MNKKNIGLSLLLGGLGGLGGLIYRNIENYKKFNIRLVIKLDKDIIDLKTKIKEIKNSDEEIFDRLEDLENQTHNLHRFKQNKTLEKSKINKVNKKKKFYFF